jgi:hypothetical protein
MTRFVGCVSQAGQTRIHTATIYAWTTRHLRRMSYLRHSAPTYLPPLKSFCCLHHQHPTPNPSPEQCCSCALIRNEHKAGECTIRGDATMVSIITHGPNIPSDEHPNVRWPTQKALLVANRTLGAALVAHRRRQGARPAPPLVGAGDRRELATSSTVSCNHRVLPPAAASLTTTHRPSSEHHKWRLVGLPAM